MSKLKRVLTIVISVLILFNLQGILAYANDEVSRTSDINSNKKEVDAEGPIVNSITLDKYTANRGETIRITIDASDESGLKDATICYLAPSGGNHKYINLYPDTITGKLVGDIYIDSDTPAGVWTLSYAIIYDLKGNSTHLGSSTEISFEVVGPPVDSQGPLVNSITLDKYTVNRGETIKITIDASDKSGLKDATICYLAPSGGNHKYINLYPDTITGKLVGDIYIDSDTPAGVWTLSYAIIYDLKGNSTHLGSSTEISFEVVGPPVDSQGPLVNSITLDKYTANK